MSKPPVILIHGFAASQSDWYSLQPTLHSAGYPAYAVDLLGHGAGLKPASREEYHLEKLYAHLVDWIDCLELETPPVVVGHSLGGYLSLLYALRQPAGVSSLVLIDPLVSMHQMAPMLRFFYKRPALSEEAFRRAPTWLISLGLSMDFTNPREQGRKLRQQTIANYKNASPYITHLPRPLRTLEPHLCEVQQPALVIWGKRDFTLSRRSFPALVRALPNATAFAVPECGHEPHRLRPEIVNPIILDFLAKINNLQS